jgi:hypothetical protein
MPAATGGLPMNEKHSWLYFAETDIDEDALYLIACSYVWQRGGDIEAGWELVRSLAKPQLLLQTIAEVGLVKAGVRSIALLETALNSGQLRFEGGGPCLQRLVLAALPDSPESCSSNYQN